METNEKEAIITEAEGKEYKKKAAEKKAEAKKALTKNQMGKCNAAIHIASAACAAFGAVPIPIIDAAPISVAQVVMVVSLGKIFDQQITKSAAKSLICAAAATFVGRNLVKLIPIGGWIASGAVAAGVTEAIGWTVVLDLYSAQKRNGNDADKADDESDAGEATIDAENEETANREKDFRMDLHDRASAFLDGRKNCKTDVEEYNQLISDFEDRLDDLDANDLLRNTYKQLFQLRFE